MQAFSAIFAVNARKPVSINGLNHVGFGPTGYACLIEMGDWDRILSQLDMKSSPYPRFSRVVVGVLSAADRDDYVLALVVTYHQNWPSLTDFMWNSGIEIASVENHLAVLVQYWIAL